MYLKNVGKIKSCEESEIFPANSHLKAKYNKMVVLFFFADILLKRTTKILTRRQCTRKLRKIAEYCQSMTGRFLSRLSEKTTLTLQTDPQEARRNTSCELNKMAVGELCKGIIQYYSISFRLEREVMLMKPKSFFIILFFFRPGLRCILKGTIRKCNMNSRFFVQYVCIYVK